MWARHDQVRVHSAGLRHCLGTARESMVGIQSCVSGSVSTSYASTAGFHEEENAHWLQRSTSAHRWGHLFHSSGGPLLLQGNVKEGCLVASKMFHHPPDCEFPSALPVPWAGLESLAGDMTQIFIPEESKPLVIILLSVPDSFIHLFPWQLSKGVSRSPMNPWPSFNSILPFLVV